MTLINSYFRKFTGFPTEIITGGIKDIFNFLNIQSEEHLKNGCERITYEYQNIRYSAKQ